MFWYFNLLTLSVPDEGYSRNESFALNLVSTFLLCLRLQIFLKQTNNITNDFAIVKSRQWVIFLLPRTLRLFGSPIFWCECTWWRLFQKRVERTKMRFLRFYCKIWCQHRGLFISFLKPISLWFNFSLIFITVISLASKQTCDRYFMITDIMIPVISVFHCLLLIFNLQLIQYVTLVMTSRKKLLLIT